MAQNYTVVDSKSKVDFVIKNLGLSVNGSFTGLKGNISINPKDLINSSLNISLNAKSVNTENKARDKHLRQDDYFDVEKYPEINFKSSTVTALPKPNCYFVEGILTIKGISKQIKTEIIISEKSAFIEVKTNFEINRRLFKVGGKSFVLSDIVKLNINLMVEKTD